ncbi:MAG: flagellar biosynthesis anti-sigma factor FlgM [Polyangiaceae bacterium]
MRIPSRIYVNQQAQVDRSQQSGGQGQAQKAQAQKPAAEDVRVEVSSRAKELAQKDAVNVEKVEALKAAIADGSFQVDSAAIAQRIVDQE